MLISILLIAIVTLGGLALTYFLESDKPLLWRVAAGSIIGQCIFGTALFVLTFAAGLNVVVVVVAAAIAAAPGFLLFNGSRRKPFEHDWAKAKGKLQGSNFQRSLPFVYYFGFFVFFVLFFDRAMMIADDGIFTGGSNNLGDLPFHLGIIFSFTDAANFPPQNPSFAGAKLTYPFIADLAAAALVKLGAGIREAMLVQNVSWAFSLLVILEGFVFRLTRDRFAARIAPFLLFLSGGLGFLWFFSDYASQSKSIFQLLLDIGKDYTITNEFRWGNSLITLFLTQRSLLLGMPLTLIVLGGLWRIFATEIREDGKDEAISLKNFILHPSSFVLGLLAGMLPLIHLHSLFVLFIVSAALFLLRPLHWRQWIAFGVGVCVIAVPELIWSITGSATRASEFFEWHFGWDHGENNVVWFWIKNTGVFIPLLVAGIIYIFSTRDGVPNTETDRKKKSKDRSKDVEKTSAVSNAKVLLLFYVPFLFLFVLANAAKLAPWEWDNIKVLIYWFIGSIPFVVLIISRLWSRKGRMRFASALLVFVLIAAGGLDVWRTVSRQHNYRVFDPDAVAIAKRIDQATPPNAIFLNAPTYNTAVVLSGRLSMMRYAGHLNSHGIDYKEREMDLKYMYRGGPGTELLFEKYGVKYVLISPEEMNTLSPNEKYYSQFPVVAQSGKYKVYDVRR